MDSTGNLLCTLYEWKEDSTLKRFLIKNVKDKVIFNIMSLYSIITLLSTFVKEQEFFDPDNPYFILIPNNHELEGFFKTKVIFISDLKNYILNELNFYESQGSSTSLRESLYQTKTNLPISCVSGELKNIEQAASNIPQLSNFNVRIRLNVNFFQVLKDTFGTELNQNLFKFTEVKDLFYRLLCIFGLKTNEPYIYTSGTILRRLTNLKILHVTQYEAFIASLSSEVNPVDLKSFPRRLKRLLKNAEIKFEFKRQRLEPSYYLRIKSSNPNSVSFKVDLSNYNFNISDLETINSDSSSDSDGTSDRDQIEDPLDIQSSSENVSEEELEIFLSDDELFQSDSTRQLQQRNVSESESESDYIFLGQINPIIVSDFSNGFSSNIDNKDENNIVSNFVTKKCISCKLKDSILPLCTKCFLKKRDTFPKRKKPRNKHKKRSFKELRIDVCPDNSSYSDDDKCKICYVESKSCGIIHGNLAHFIGCMKCINKINKETGRCPVCRRKIERIIKII